MKPIQMLYGRQGLTLQLPDSATILEGAHIPAISDPANAVFEKLARPIKSASLHELLQAKRPKTVAITVSDITRPVPNREFLPPMLAVLNQNGVPDSTIAIIIGTGMHRPSTTDEMVSIVGKETYDRVEVFDHNAHDPKTLIQVCAPGELSPGEPGVYVCRRFVEADFRIVTGYIEPHFMAGFSGGRKGVCPALVDLQTVQRFHGYKTLADAKAANGILEGNPCHDISLKVARAVGCDFLFNVSITRDRNIAGIYCGDLEDAHAAGCAEVAGWCSADVSRPFDLVVTNAGGYPLDQTYYQTVKGMVAALQALSPNSTLLIVSHCGEGVGSKAYSELAQKYGGDWRRFLSDIASAGETKLDQWQIQMQARVLERIGPEKLLLATDALTLETQSRLGVTPVTGEGDARTRAQRVIDEFVAKNPKATVAGIPEGPYVMLRGQ